MKGTLGARVAVSMAAMLLAAAARADTVVLNDGREIHGKTSVEGAKVVVRTDNGETSFPRDEVAKVKKLPAKALEWEKDGAEATRLASEAKKIVLTFSVVGELGTGHC